MQIRTNTQTPTSIIYLSMLTILLQFGVYYLFESNIIIWALASLIVILCCYVLVEHTLTYFSCLHYSFLCLFISVIIITLTYMGKVQTHLPYTHGMLGIALINGLLPLFFSFIKNMLDSKQRVEDFYEYYRNYNIFLIFIYILALLYGCFIADSSFWINGYGTKANFSLFNSISIKVENYIFVHIPFSDIFVYLMSRILIYIPYGFYISLLLRNQSRLKRNLSLLILPLVLKVLQYFIINPRCDIDDIFYAFLGGLLGSLLFFLTCFIFRAFSGRDFYGEDPRSRYLGTPIHF